MKYTAKFCFVLVTLCLLTACQSDPMSMIPASDQLKFMEPNGQGTPQAQGNTNHLPVSQRLFQLQQQYAAAQAKPGLNRGLALQFQPQQKNLTARQQQKLQQLIKTHNAELLAQVDIIGGPSRGGKKLKAVYRTEQRMQQIAKLFQQQRIATNLYFDPNLTAEKVTITLHQNKQ